jgi:signal transduction histidine kinase
MSAMPFLAGMWFSTYRAESGGNRLAAIIVDLSEELVSREDLSLDSLLKNARILMSAVSHEMRNLAGAALVFHQNLTRVKTLDGNEDFEALGTLIHGLEKLSAMELTPGATEQDRQTVELAPVLDELRVLIETVCRDSDIELEWTAIDQSRSVWADKALRDSVSRSFSTKHVPAKPSWPFLPFVKLAGLKISLRAVNNAAAAFLFHGGRHNRPA